MLGCDEDPAVPPPKSVQKRKAKKGEGREKRPQKNAGPKANLGPVQRGCSALGNKAPAPLMD
jgi:hypothetical protein